MRLESHVSVASAKVRDRHLPRHAALRLAAGRAFFVATAFGWPRLWAPLRESTGEAFEAALRETNGQAGKARLEAAMRAAQAALASETSALIEREPHDVAVLGALLDGAELHIHRAGAGRAYLHRAGKADRITPRDEPEGGLLAEALFQGAVLLDPGDLLLLGSATAFSNRAVDKVSSVLAQDPNAPPSVLASLLTEPAEEAGVGAAAIALRAL